jgi:Dyp-type peroxidase family
MSTVPLEPVPSSDTSVATLPLSTHPAAQVAMPGRRSHESREAQRVTRHVPAVTPEQDVESAKLDGRTRQGSLLVMVAIRDGQQPALERLLEEIAHPPGGEDLEVNPVIPFRRLGTVHFARILIHAASPSDEVPIPEWEGRPQASGPPIPAKLLLSTDYDGPLAAHLDELLREAGPGLDRLFSHCDGWPGHAHRAAAGAFFMRHRVRSNTFYSGTANRSVAQIRREAVLREHIEHYLDAYVGTPGFPTDPLQIRARLQEWVLGQRSFEWVKQPPGGYPRPLIPAAVVNSPWFRRALLLAAAVLVAAVALLQWWILLGVLVGLAGAGFAAYRYLSRLAAHDPVIIRSDLHQHTASLVRTEDRIVQNEMSSVIYIKRPLWFRRLVLQAVLAFINFSARYLSNEGTLAGIPSIHFARWVIVDGGRRLVFFSNFDGSWENYLGDFIDKAHTGLTAVWSHCVGFPRTVGLTGEGAKDEQRFKAYSRQSQIRTQVWYSAYRWLTVSNINDNTRLRLGLYGDLDTEAARGWLRMAAPRQRLAVTRTDPPPPAAVEVADVQGLVVRSYPMLEHAVYVPVAFDGIDPAIGRAWVRDLTAAVTPGSRSGAEVGVAGWALNIAFTYSGLSALGIDRTTLGFSREFMEGMAGAHRQRLLGDTGSADPGMWKWGGPANPPVHALLFLFASTPERLTTLIEAERMRAATFRVTLREPLDTVMLPADKEHFGFHDGIAQPRIAGMGTDRGPAAPVATIPAGEVLLGYANAYGVIPLSPTVRAGDSSAQGLPLASPDPAAPAAAPTPPDFGRNGSYVVFRQLRQDVKAFWRFIDASVQSDPERRKWLAAKMVGRWPNGAPLVQHPEREPERFDRTTANDFFYRDDLAGDRCPVGAHVRRSNPRDGAFPDTQASLVVADRHRLLRRGRAYGPPVAASFDPADILAAPDDPQADRGLHFICFNTDIARQFEFVQSTWLNSMKFDGLYADPDPIAAPHPDPATAKHDEEIGTFTVQQCPVRHRLSNVPQFVTMIGGAYLFMPGLKALAYIGGPDNGERGDRMATAHNGS